MGRDLAIDLGTANTVVYREGDGIVFAQPTVVALRVSTGDVIAIGDDVARVRGGDSGNVIAMRPLRSGAITEFEVTQRFLAGVLRKTAPGPPMRMNNTSFAPANRSSANWKRALLRMVMWPGC